MSQGSINSDLPNFSPGLPSPAAVVSEETALAHFTGTGATVRKISPVIVAPTIADLTNMQHSHQNAAGGGALSAAAITSGTLTDARLSSNVPLKDAANSFSANQTVDADLKLGTAGNGLYVKEGANATLGRAVLVGGTVTVNTTKVTALSEIFLSVNVPGGTLGTIYVSARVAGTSFTITSLNVLDTSTISWFIVEPA